MILILKSKSKHICLFLESLTKLFGMILIDVVL